MNGLSLTEKTAKRSSKTALAEATEMKRAVTMTALGVCQQG